MLVQLIESLVFELQPMAKIRGAVVTVTGTNVRAEFIVDVPHDDARLFAVAGREMAYQSRGVVPIYGAVRTIMLPRAGRVARAISGHRQRIGMKFRQPGWGRGSRGRQIDENFILLKKVDDTVKPVEGVSLGIWLQLRPTEDSEGHEIHSRSLHQLDIFNPNRLGPLLRIVISAVEQLGKFRTDHGPPSLVQLENDGAASLGKEKRFKLQLRQ